MLDFLSHLPDEGNRPIPGGVIERSHRALNANFIGNDIGLTASIHGSK